ncbi:hypothetical protein TNIN_329241 [Trichonephila inaurata madagascariensis]|uniref:Uncharacterized protein n=1 Tax=Trichonephila inaurata madagascariensis TaxID=2747483 RepID=A0A8X6WR13_9ARAC|nr:hypothetical protein TNIN_329241 [Trichonephila inaurata madagascariensis]
MPRFSPPGTLSVGEVNRGGVSRDMRRTIRRQTPPKLRHMGYRSGSLLPGILARLLFECAKGSHAIYKLSVVFITYSRREQMSLKTRRKKSGKIRNKFIVHGYIAQKEVDSYSQHEKQVKCASIDS